MPWLGELIADAACSSWASSVIRRASRAMLARTIGMSVAARHVVDDHRAGMAGVAVDQRQNLHLVTDRRA